MKCVKPIKEQIETTSASIEIPPGSSVNHLRPPRDDIWPTQMRLPDHRHRVTITMVAVFIFRALASRVSASLTASPPAATNATHPDFIDAVSIEFRRRRQSIWPTDGRQRKTRFRNVPEFGSIYVISSNVLYADAFPDVLG